MNFCHFLNQNGYQIVKNNNIFKKKTFRNEVNFIISKIGKIL